MSRRGALPPPDCKAQHRRQTAGVVAVVSAIEAGAFGAGALSRRFRGLVARDGLAKRRAGR
ncbi:hypothetical protein [Phaeovulum sp.]|uniref:hypothetical protein n=1 Tax=Phaeovulum sp. TaxID=2934796 RepID=UPI0039E30A45